MLKTFLRWTFVCVLAAVLNGCVTPSKAPPPATPGPPQIRYEPVNWNQIEGWQRDSVQDAWSAFLNSCRAVGQRAEWMNVCADAASAMSPRTFFESRFTAYRMVQTEGLHRVIDTGLITGYYEPVLRGARRPSATYPIP